MIHLVKNTELALFHMINDNPGRMDSMLTRFPVILLLAMCLSSTGHGQQQADNPGGESQFEKNVQKLIDERLVDPEHTALLVVGMQNEFLSAEGGYTRQATAATRTSNPDKHQLPKKFKDEVGNLKHLLDEARRHGILVIYTKYMTLDPSGTSLLDGPVLWRFQKQGWIPRTVEGEWTAEIIPELEPHPGDVVLRHSSENAFLNTSLKNILQNRKSYDKIEGTKPVTRILVTGMNLGNGLDPAIMTNYGATQNGVGSFPVIDCLCREQRQHQNFWVDHNWIPYTSGEIIAAWKKITP